MPPLGAGASGAVALALSVVGAMSTDDEHVGNVEATSAAPATPSLTSSVAASRSPRSRPRPGIVSRSSGRAAPSSIVSAQRAAGR